MRRATKIFIAIILTAAIGLPVAATAGPLTQADKAHLVFMRSEEKLARDVYLTLGAMYPNQPVFLKIAGNAEQTHTDTMLNMIEKFGLDDPEPTTPPDVLPDPDNPTVGAFENYWFGVYFEEKFKKLTGLGGDGLLEALYVGALIEELDMMDIDVCNDEAFSAYWPYPGDPPDPCGGLAVTQVKALQNTLSNLLAGSENHLCAFISQIGPIDGVCYESQVLSQGEVFEIITRNCSEFSGFVCEPQPEP
jgi:hypothetical protein